MGFYPFFMLWDFVLWDFVLWDFVRRDFILWNSVPDSHQEDVKRAHAGKEKRPKKRWLDNIRENMKDDGTRDTKSSSYAAHEDKSYITTRRRPRGEKVRNETLVVCVLDDLLSK